MTRFHAIILSLGIVLLLGSCSDRSTVEVQYAESMSGCLNDNQVKGLNWLAGRMERNLKAVFETDSTIETYKMLLAYHADENDVPNMDPFHDVTESHIDSWLAYDSSRFYFDVNLFAYDYKSEDTPFGAKALSGRFEAKHGEGWRVTNPDSRFADCLIRNNQNPKLQLIYNSLKARISPDSEEVSKMLRKELRDEDWEDVNLRLFVTVYLYFNDASIRLKIIKALMSPEEQQRLR